MKGLVLYASQRLTGPGRGLLQLIEAVGPRVNYTLCSFARPGVTSDFHRAAVDRGIHAKVIPQTFAWDPRMLKACVEVARSGRFAFVQSHGYKTHLLAMVIRRQLRIPWVAVSHGWTNENARIRFYNRIDQALLSHADVAIAVAPDLARKVGALRPGRRTVTVLNAIEKDRFAPRARAKCRARVRAELGLDVDAPLLVVIGRLSHEKGQDLLLDALERATWQDDRPHTAFVGEGPELRSLEQATREKGLGSRVHFVGFDHDVARYFLATDLLVLPSRSEGLPNVVMEAQLLGCPVVSFDVGGVAEQIEPDVSGWLVGAEDVEGLTRAIEDAFRRPDKRRAFAEAASERLFPKFGVEARALAFVNEYERLTGRGQ